MGASPRAFITVGCLILVVGCTPPLGSGIEAGRLAVDAPSGRPSMASVLRSVIPGVVGVTAIADVSGADHLLMTEPDLRRALSRAGIDVPDPSRTLRRQRIGSGLIWDAPRGLILTNAGLVDGADQVIIRATDGRVYEGRLLGVSHDADVAVLHVESLSMPTVRRGRSDRVEVGDGIMVIGSPFGLSPSVTSGIVSAVGRTHPEAARLGPLIQTDAAIQPGLAGGPLINTSGDVVGMITRLEGRGHDSAGVGFAVPIERVERAVREILARSDMR